MKFFKSTASNGHANDVTVALRKYEQVAGMAANTKRNYRDADVFGGLESFCKEIYQRIHVENINNKREK